MTPLTWLALSLALAVEPVALAPIPVDRTLQQLPAEATPREQLAAAAEGLGDWTVLFAGVELDGPRLARLAATPEDEPLLRAVREDLGRAVDLEDFVYLLDDILVAGTAGRRGEPFDIHAGRARSYGTLVHPDEVFEGKPRVYPYKPTLPVDTPPEPDTFPPATDGDPPGPGWTARFTNPSDRVEAWAALASERPSSGFASRIAALIWQLEHQGAEVYLTSSVRDRTRGYLMWGAFELSRADDAAQVEGICAVLDARNGEWGLDAPITWRHPDGWEATVEGARQMADAYDVVYATEKGARSSNHYGGVAVDVVAIDLPRELHLLAPDGQWGHFDLSDPEQTRDLSLSPDLIEWVEAHFGLSKLRSDYPHWNDARR